jgi:MFS family permease
MLWYNFLSLYLGSFFEVEEVGLLLSILTAGGTLSIILGGLLADSLGRRLAIAIAIIGVAVAAVALGFSKIFMALALVILVFSLCFQSLRIMTPPHPSGRGFKPLGLGCYPSEWGLWFPIASHPGPGALYALSTRRRGFDPATPKPSTPAKPHHSNSMLLGGFKSLNALKLYASPTSPLKARFTKLEYHRSAPHHPSR